MMSMQTKQTTRNKSNNRHIHNIRTENSFKLTLSLAIYLIIKSDNVDPLLYLRRR
jgi:hypothetical protein